MVVDGALFDFGRKFVKPTRKAGKMYRVKCHKCRKPNPIDTKKCVYCGVILKLFIFQVPRLSEAL